MDGKKAARMNFRVLFLRKLDYCVNGACPEGNDGLSL